MLNDFIEQICDTFRDAICVSDRDGKVLLVNRRHAELTGIPREEMLRHRIQDLMEKGYFDVVLNPLVVETRQKASSVQHVFNGRILMLESHPVLDKEGKVVLVVTIIRDVTALTELREEVSAQKELLETFQTLNNPEMLTTGKYPRIIQSQSMQRLYAEAAAIADTDATVLLLGETGVGKDVVARHIHHSGQRADRPFIKVDCGSIPENLIETELFGYAAGSFSGASKNGKAGLIEAANTGTLFLDEIGELPMIMQSRLLRVLQDWEVMRVGSTTPKPVDVRVIAATNKDLQKEVSRSNFRSDLYYRLKVAVLNIPPLRRRQADILPLAASFLAYYGKKFHKHVRFSHEVERMLLAYDWPGNVRELENLVQGIVVTCKKGIIDAHDLTGIRPVGQSPPVSDGLPLPDIEGKSFKTIMKEVEAAVIEAGMRRYGSMAELARYFQVDRSTIFRKVRELKRTGKERA